MARQTPTTTVTWIPSHVALAEHPKVHRLSEALGESENAILGMLHRLWWYAARYAQDGDLAAFTPAELARACHVPPRKAADFVKHLQAVGWLTATMGITGWELYTGRFIRQQADARDRMRSRRAANVGGNTVQTPERPPTVTQHATGTVSAPLPNRRRTVRTNITVQNTTQHPTGDAPLAAVTPGHHRDLWSVFDTTLGPARTHAERGRRAAAVRDLAEANITPDTLALGLANWPRVMPGATCSETGVAANIGKLTSGFQAARGTVAAPSGALAVLSRWQEAADEHDEASVPGGHGTVVGRLSEPQPNG